MRLVRFEDAAGVIQIGDWRADGTADLLTDDVFASQRRLSGERIAVGKLLAPVVPAAIIAIGLNYWRHAAECGAAIPEWPMVMYKGPNTLQNPGDPILLPRHLRSDEVDYECELAVVIGRGPDGTLCKNVSPNEAVRYVLGYSCANEVSARDWQLKRGNGQWCRGKSFDTFLPLGPCLVTPDELPDPGNLRIRTVLNGQAVQDWNTSDMIFDVPRLVSFLSGSSTLLPGTVIVTGTPHGVGMAARPEPRWLRSGDVVSVEIEGIGALTNPVAEEVL